MLPPRPGSYRGSPRRGSHTGRSLPQYRGWGAVPGGGGAAPPQQAPHVAHVRGGAAPPPSPDRPPPRHRPRAPGTPGRDPHTAGTGVSAAPKGTKSPPVLQVTGPERSQPGCCHIRQRNKQLQLLRRAHNAQGVIFCKTSLTGFKFPLKLRKASAVNCRN